MQNSKFHFTTFLFFATLSLSILIGLSTISFADNYIVGPGDVLKIDVYDHEDLKKTVRVPTMDLLLFLL